MTPGRAAALCLETTAKLRHAAGRTRLPPFVLAALFSVAASCAGPCVNTAVRELPSPDGRFVATAFVRDCGATTSHSPQVYLRRAGAPAGATGNVFRGDRSDRIEISWRSPRELVVKSDCEVIHAEEAYDGVRVVFEPER